MKKFTGFMIAGLMALALFLGAPKKAEATYCLQYVGTFCIAYAPTPLPGFTTVSSGYVAADSEVVMCDSAGDCAKDKLGPGGFYNLASLGDWSPNQYFIKGWSSSLHGSVRFFSGTNFTGSVCTLAAGARSSSDIPTLCGFKAASLGMQN